MSKTLTKLKLLHSATPETRELVAEAWEQGKYQGRTQAPVFNFKGKMPALPKARWWLQNAILIPFWVTMPIWLPFQLPWFAMQAIYWATEDAYKTDDRSHWFTRFDHTDSCRFTYWLETTFPKE